MKTANNEVSVMAINVPRMMTLQATNDYLESIGFPRRENLTLISWIKKYNLGWKVAGTWMVVEERLQAFLRGQKGAPENEED